MTNSRDNTELTLIVGVTFLCDIFRLKWFNMSEAFAVLASNTSYRYWY
jgi:hypothetical protein